MERGGGGPGGEWPQRGLSIIMKNKPPFFPPVFQKKERTGNSNLLLSHYLEGKKFSLPAIPGKRGERGFVIWKGGGWGGSGISFGKGLLIGRRRMNRKGKGASPPGENSAGKKGGRKRGGEGDLKGCGPASSSTNEGRPQEEGETYRRKSTDIIRDNKKDFKKRRPGARGGTHSTSWGR